MNEEQVTTMPRLCFSCSRLDGPCSRSPSYQPATRLPYRPRRLSLLDHLLLPPPEPIDLTEPISANPELRREALAARPGRARVHCPVCGMFAKVISSEWVYLGYGSEYRLTVRCFRHGVQEVY